MSLSTMRDSTAMVLYCRGGASTLDMVKEVAAVCTRPSITSALISAQIIVFVAQLALGSPRLELACAQLEPPPRGGEHYRLITACFLHASITHLLSNAVGIARLGPGLASALGVEATWLIFLLSGVAGNLASMVFGIAPHKVALEWLARYGFDHDAVVTFLTDIGIEPPPPADDDKPDGDEAQDEDEQQLEVRSARATLPAPTQRRLERVESMGVGASGSIYGQSGAFAGYALRNPSKESMTAAATSLGEVLMYSLVTPVFDRNMTNVDHSAHLGGYACGMLLGYLLAPDARLRQPAFLRPPVVKLACWLATFAAVASLREGWRATLHIVRAEQRWAKFGKKPDAHDPRSQSKVRPKPAASARPRAPASSRESSADAADAQTRGDVTAKRSDDDDDAALRRLSLLRKSFELGLLSEAEYAAKRKELIDAL